MCIGENLVSQQGDNLEAKFKNSGMPMSALFVQLVHTMKQEKQHIRVNQLLSQAKRYNVHPVTLGWALGYLGMGVSKSREGLRYFEHKPMPKDLADPMIWADDLDQYLKDQDRPAKPAPRKHDQRWPRASGEHDQPRAQSEPDARKSRNDSDLGDRKDS